MITLDLLAVLFWQCDDGCKYSTHSVNLRVMGDSGKGTTWPNYPRCNGRLGRQVC